MNKTPDNWFVVQVKPNGFRRASVNLERQGFKTFVPFFPNQPTKPLFSGYIFVQFDPLQARWTKINSTYGVSRLLTDPSCNPERMPSQWMSGLIARCFEDGVLRPPDDLQVGDLVRVNAGPFADHVLRIDALDKNGRIKALFEILGRKSQISLAPEDVHSLKSAR